MEQINQELLRAMHTPTDGLTLDDLKANRELHGKLTGCSYYTSSNGMMYNSNTVLHISLTLQDGAQQITYISKAAFQPTTKTVYKLNQDALASVQELAEQENLAAWSALKYHNQFQCMDYSSSASISLYYDDRSVGGSPYAHFSIDVDAACQHGGGDVVQRFRNLLEAAVKDAEVISTETTGHSAGFMMGMGMMDVTSPTPAQDGAWNCKCCGKTGNTSKFCPECGSRRDADLSAEQRKDTQ